MNIYVFGNDAVPEDAAAVRLMPVLSRRFPLMTFIPTDPTEEWIGPGDDPLVIIDTVRGIPEVRLYTDPEPFARTSSDTVHDFDLGMTLVMLSKLGRLGRLLLIGIPQGASPDRTADAVCGILARELEPVSVSSAAAPAPTAAAPARESPAGPRREC